MLAPFAWNCSHGLRALTCAGLILLFMGGISSPEARYCGESFDLGAARTRWADARQSGPSSQDPDQVCRAYGHQFYQAVEARQAVSECKAGLERQKALEMLDGEIEAFNNLIATHCGT
jgi:hypothetical protein